jgi:DNA recombination protein RmuC
MILALTVAAVVLLVVVIVLLAVLLARRPDSALTERMAARLDALESHTEKLERALRDELARTREEHGTGAKHLREEVGGALAGLRDSHVTTLSEFSRTQGERFQGFSGDLARVVATIEKKLEEMRKTVDEQLQGTLERRLGEQFKLVSDRLDQVHKGLGEMQTLATGVGDLKRVLTNVKTRGGWGEAQLAKLLEDSLTRDQYDVNVATRPGSNERVEFAIRLPGRGNGEGHVWLPIDAKFPKEDYERLLDAADRADPDAMEVAARALESRIKDEAWDLCEKYLEPPHTTDFAILFLPSEGLYAEVLRRPGLVDHLQRECRALVAGPTTLWAILNSLQMGFRTLAIEQRTSEVWEVLGAVKSEFGRFGDVLSKVKKKLDSASNEIDSATRRTRVISRKLREVEELPAGESRLVLGEGLEADADVLEAEEASEEEST